MLRPHSEYRGGVLTGEAQPHGKHGGGGRGGGLTECCSAPRSCPIVNTEEGSSLRDTQHHNEYRGGVLIGGCSVPPPQLPHSEHREGVSTEGCSVPIVNTEEPPPGGSSAPWQTRGGRRGGGSSLGDAQPPSPPPMAAGRVGVPTPPTSRLKGRFQETMPMSPDRASCGGGQDEDGVRMRTG